MYVCPVCVKEFNARKNRRIRCWKCEVNICSHCVETYILNNNKEPECMDCRAVWGYKFLLETMSKAFLAKLRKRDINLLVEREKGLLVETHKYIEYNQYILGIEEKLRETKIRLEHIRCAMVDIMGKLSLNKCPKCDKDELYYVSEYCYKCLTQLCLHCRMIVDDPRTHVCDQNKKRLLTKYKEYMNERYDLTHELSAMEKCIKRWRRHYNMDEDVLKSFANSVIICMCPVNNCKGFVVNYVCNMCKVDICRSCYYVYEVGHVCNKDNIESIRTMKKVTKPCPKCAVLIEKVDGCNQMWCTHCHCAFDWMSGKVETGAIDNPHYFEWRRKMGFTSEREPIEGIPNPVRYMNHLIVVLKRSCEHSYNVLVSLFRILLHLHDMIQESENRTVDPIKVNLDLRLRWVFGMIDDKKWGNTLFKRNKKQKINHEKNVVFRTFVTASSDISHRVLYHDNYIGMNDSVNEWIQLVEYTNECFRILSKLFKLQMPSITMNETFNYELNMKSK